MSPVIRSCAPIQTLLAFDPALIILNAGQTEVNIGNHGEPLVDAFEDINRINYLFPALVALVAAQVAHTRPLDVVAIGSIVDGSPSCFAPVNQASKVALHYFFTGTGPIIHHGYPHIRLRLYRPGAIKGPFAWAPVNRLNDKGYRIRAKRCANAPDADTVARRIIEWINGDQWVGTYREPFSLKLFKYVFALAPNLFYQLQRFGWRKGSPFTVNSPQNSFPSPSDCHSQPSPRSRH